VGQCDQTICEKSTQICQNVVKKGALVNKNFCPEQITGQILGILRQKAVKI
jgi:hypothetical protein